MAPALLIEGLRKTFPGPPPIEAVAGIDLEVAPGEIFALLGPNGAGKTTTVGICTTRVRAGAGRVLVGGRDVTAHGAAIKRSIGVVPQYNTLDRACTVHENLYYHCRYFGFSGGEATRRTLGARPDASDRHLPELASDSTPPRPISEARTSGTTFWYPIRRPQDRNRRPERGSARKSAWGSWSSSP